MKLFNEKYVPVLVVLVFFVVVTAYMMLKNKEGFDANENKVMENVVDSFLKQSGNSNDNGVVAKKDIEKAARAAALQYCPVPPDYNPSLFIRKTEIEKERECPKMPNLKDYVLKSSIPPSTECPPCICPKVNVSADLCKDGKKAGADKVCPSCAPCSVEQCKNVVKCPAPNSFGTKITDDSVRVYVNKLIADKDYKRINKLKMLLKNINTPSDLVSDLQEENNELRDELRKLKNRVSKMGDMKMDNMMQVRKNTNSPVVEYNQKCENNRINDWYDISGIIASPFNSMRNTSNNTLPVEEAMAASNNMAASNSFMNRL